MKSTLKNRVRCSFCLQRASRHLVKGKGTLPVAYVCDDCLRGCILILAEKESRRPSLSPTGHGPTNELRCSFCGKPEAAIKALVGSRHSPTYICDECIDHSTATCAHSRAEHRMSMFERVWHKASRKPAAIHHLPE